MSYSSSSSWTAIHSTLSQSLASNPHWHSSVHTRTAYVHEHIEFWHLDFAHLQCMSSITASGAGFSNFLTGKRQPSSFVHPWGKYWIRDVSMCSCRAGLVGGSFLHSAWFFLNSNHLTPPGSLLLVTGKYNWQVVVVNHCFTSLFGTKGILSDNIIR